MSVRPASRWETRIPGSGHERLDSFFVVDSFVERLIDAVGAGDALLAYGTLAMLVTRNAVIATILGSMAAACECEMDGNVPIKSENISAKIDTIEKQVSEGR
jgi:sugar/nucleoside kinase (ribokinase family)